jgi:FKBP-type peptidyl-prolyl cis-trans isomerase
MSKRPLALTAAAVTALTLSACGSSAAPGVEQAPGAGATQASVPKTTPTPTSGPLSKKPVVTVPSTPAPTHLVVKDLIPGTGKTAQPGSTITVNYVGDLYSNGNEFDSSWKRNQPFTTTLKSGVGGVIQGWVKGIAGMKVGGRRELIIPPSLGYGKQGSPPTIPANSTLIFVVDLLSVS